MLVQYYDFMSASSGEESKNSIYGSLAWFLGRSNWSFTQAFNASPVVVSCNIRLCQALETMRFSIMIRNHKFCDKKKYVWRRRQISLNHFAKVTGCFNWARLQDNKPVAGAFRKRLGWLSSQRWEYLNGPPLKTTLLPLPLWDFGTGLCHQEFSDIKILKFQDCSSCSHHSWTFYATAHGSTVCRELVQSMSINCILGNRNVVQKPCSN